MPDPPPNYESYDYSREWYGKRLNDLSEKLVIRSWIPIGAGRILELGTGFGRITKMLESIYPSSNIVSIDYSWNNVVKVSGSLSKRNVVGLVRSDIRTIPCKSDSFDAVLMIRVAHHLSAPSVVLDEICRVAKDASSVIISLPNPILSKNRRSSEVEQIYTGSEGHRIYSTPFAAYTNDRRLLLLERRGTGIFENKVGIKLESLSHLELVDVVTSPLWFLKKNIFLRFRVRK